MQPPCGVIKSKTIISEYSLRIFYSEKSDSIKHDSQNTKKMNEKTRVLTCPERLTIPFLVNPWILLQTIGCNYSTNSVFPFNLPNKSYQSNGLSKQIFEKTQFFPGFPRFSHGFFGSSKWQGRALQRPGRRSHRRPRHLPTWPAQWDPHIHRKFVDLRPIKMVMCHLVGGWATPLKNMSSSIGMMTFPIYGKIKHVPNHQPVIVIC